MPLPDNYFQGTRVTRGGKNGRVILSEVVHHGYYRNNAAFAPAAVVTNGLVTTLAGPNATTLTLIPTSGLNGSLVSGGFAIFDVARNVVITVTHGTAVVALSGLISGTDGDGSAMTETWAVTATGTTKTYTGAKAFKTITSITVIGATDASADSIIVGSGNVLGVRARITCPSAVKELLDGAVVTNGTLVAGVHGSATVDPIGTYAPATAPNATHIYDVWYLSDSVAAGSA